MTCIQLEQLENFELKKNKIQLNTVDLFFSLVPYCVACSWILNFVISPKSVNKPIVNWLFVEH